MLHDHIGLLSDVTNLLSKIEFQGMWSSTVLRATGRLNLGSYSWHETVHI